jgi:DHA2 family multidrug resistance protein
VFMIAFAHRWDPRLLFMIGFGLQTYAALVMMQFDMNVSLGEIAWLMIIQGFGVGCIWVPMTLVTFSNFDPRRTADGSAIFHFVRSIASSYYISASYVVVFHSQKINYSDMVQWINPFSERLRLADALGQWDIETTVGLTNIAGEVSLQATTIGYINAFNLFLWTSLLVYPLIALIAWPPKGYRPRK